jgi:hypothetical protein
MHKIFCNRLASAPPCSENSRPIDMTTNPTGTIIHGTREEEEPPLVLPTHPTQPLQVQHLAQWHPPERQNILMHIIRLGGRPPLESRSITPHRRKVAVVEPVENRLFLFQASVVLSICGWIDGVFPKSEGVAFFPRCFVILFHESRADEDDIPNLDISSLSGGSDVNALSFSTGFEVGIGDPVRGVAAVGDVLGLGVGIVVEEEGAAGEAVVGPVVDAVFVVGGRAVDIGAADAVVKGVGGNMGELG